MKSFPLLKFEPPGILAVSPLGKLINLLSDEFPPDEGYSNVDMFQRLDGEFDDAAYRSKIFFLARRLIILAQWAVKRSPTSDEASVIGQAIEDVFDITLLEKPEVLKQLVVECSSHSAKTIPNGLKSQIAKNAETSSNVCYLCGTQLNYSSSGEDDSCEVEHVLPRSLGGGNITLNLVAACRKCNGHKKNRIADVDIHFESMVYPHVEKGPYKISEFHEFAVRFFTGAKCSMCGKPAHSQGEMASRLGDFKDAWHLFNVELICANCAS